MLYLYRAYRRVRMLYTYNATPNLAINIALAIVLPGMTFISVDLYPTKVTHALTYTCQHLGASRLQLLQRNLVVSDVVEEIPSAVEVQWTFCV